MQAGSGSIADSPTAGHSVDMDGVRDELVRLAGGGTSAQLAAGELGERLHRGGHPTSAIRLNPRLRSPPHAATAAPPIRN
jgi:hypothetical protein